eukprot:CAMPEP_0201884738 /NCGR_PEP_ID=MMETSP0902-20130614/17527_1 /ASSEMBLY_ACC=CAM_ASM_000551 /TAXON_ID=420261 /ORGANISM="Thalassiosira antarctica, Strain CCMP982" /LENGTH=726 /DNA_ID=CAMNT_0048413745 /DNA_START=175 /DNA_END=2355 /DNA_ORIENTATION=-
MKRPSALKGAVCGTTSGAAKAKDKENTIILQNKGAKASSISLLEKEEKRDDHGIMIMKPGRGQAGSSVVGENATPTNDASKSESASSPSRVAAATTDAGIKTAWDPLEEVDSALLSALCDARERKALFRLEQVMIDFMKNKSFVSMEVGGAFNSIVLNQNTGSGSNNGDTSDGQSVSQQGLQDFQYQQQRGLRQTSFQRLILHRLADRFDIIREQVNNTNNTGNERGLLDVGGSSNAGQAPSFSPGLIRLVKTNASCIPSHLLIGIDLSLLVNYKNPRARNYGGGDNNANTAAANGNNYEDSGTRKLSENMASATLEAPSVKTSSVSSKKLKKKMVIMKRTSSSESGSDIDGKGKQKGKSRRKKLEDREKAYEEARARIFGISESSGNENNEGGEDDNAEKGERPSVPQSADLQDNAATPLTSCHSSFSLENDATSPTSTAVREHIVPSQLISATPSTDHSSPPSPESQQEGDKESTSPPRAASEVVDTSRQPSFPSSISPAPAAVTSGAIFKAVYRNRQQEENDPDFKRRNDVRPAYVPYAANPYGAGYVNPAMGQQPPPQMMAMHVQQQQQAHQPHFYHGSQPNPQFPTPQDAAAYASNVGNNPPPQWTAAPSRAYYPPPQQQGQQEKHPQAWQPRPTSSQMPPTNGSSSNSGNNYGAQFNAPTNNTMNNSQPKQPTKVVLWGPGAQGDGGEPDKAVSRAVEGAPTGGKEGAAVYKPEDFPALG